MAPSQLKQLKESLKERGLLGVKPSQRAKIQKQQRTRDTPTNPYELKFAKTKHQVLNRKVKGVDGKPSATRRRASENRERDLLPEMRDKLKTGVFEDKRIGEKNPNMTIEDKMFDRFVQEQKRKQKGSMFNLEDDTLTHMGQSLSTIDDFNESDSDTSSHGGIQFSTVRHDHFGNFNDPSPLTPENTHANGDKKTKAEVMKEVIAKSKHFKEVRRVQREEDYEGGEALDEEFDEIRDLLMAGNKCVDIPEERNGTEGKAYDMFVRELATEKRAAPTDRLKTDQETAMEEKTKLERLEKERLARMNGTSSGGVSDRQAQGDDLNEFMYGNDQDRTIVEYNRDGELVAVRGDEIVLNEQGEMQESSEEDESEEESVGGSDNVSSEDESESDNEGMEPEYTEEETAYFSCSDGGTEDVTDVSDVLESIVSVTAPAKELPFIFTAPQTYADLRAYTDNTTAGELDTIITRIRVLHSVNLGGENRQKLLTLFSLLYQEYDTCTSGQMSLQRITVLQSHLFSLSLQFSAQATTHALARILLLQKSFKTNPAFCSTSDLMYLNLISVVFSVSDMKHSVVIPALTYMCMVLGLVGIKSEGDVTRGLFLCRDVMRCVKVSGRIAPEVYNFLFRSLRVLQTRERDEEEGAYPVHPQDKRMLASVEGISNQPLMLSTLLSGTKADKSCRAGLLVATYRMLFKCATHMQQSVSFMEQFEPLQKFLVQASAEVQGLFGDEIKLFGCQMAKSALLRRPLRMQTRKPVPIASYLPKFDEKFSLDRKSTDPNAERAAAAKLSYEHKREFKGAVRELKRDADFIATEKLKVIREKDGEYQKKIKGIMGHLATQEGAMRGYEREKKRGKR